MSANYFSSRPKIPEQDDQIHSKLDNLLQETREKIDVVGDQKASMYSTQTVPQ